MSDIPNDPILIYKRKGTKDDPFLLKQEIKQVYGGRVILTEIPDKGNHVTVTDSNNISYGEVYSRISLSSNNVYFVDYGNGIVYFDPSKEGLTFTFNYLGVAVTSIPATRVYTQSSNGTITQDVQDMIDNYNQLNGTDLYNLFDPQTGHKHTGGAGDAPAIDSQYVTYNNGSGTVSKVKDTLDSYATQLATNTTKLGDLTQLNTTDKSSVVNAIKEIKTEANSNQSSLTTTNTNVSNLQTQVNSMGSGSPKGTYATLSALQTAFPSGTTGVYLVTADGKWYYWNGSAWTAGGVYQSTGISKGSITPSQTTFINEGTNKFDISKHGDSTQTKGYFIQAGTLVSNGNYAVTNNVYLDPNQTYTLSRATWGGSVAGARGSMFDANNNYIGAWDNVTQITPANFSYVRFTVYTTAQPLNDLMILIGTTVPSSFVPYSLTVDSSITVPLPTITPDKTSFLTPSSNLLDLTTLGSPTTGYYIQSGSLITNGNYNVVAPIYLQPNTQYTLSQAIWGSAGTGARGSMYDANNNYIGNWDTTTFTTPYNFSYVKFTQYVPTYPNLNNLMIVKGTTVPSSFVPFSITLSSEVTLPQLNQFQAFSYPIYVKRSGNTITVSSKYNASNDLQVTIKPVGQSLLPQLASLDLKANTAHNVLNDFTNVTNIVTIGTDLVGPYVVLAKNNITGSLPNSAQFTGGWHGYNGDQTGTPTANNHKLDLYVDGIKNNADGSYGGSEVKVIVVNGIYASNTMNADGTGREVLQEYVTYTFKPNGEIQVENRIEMSEDVSLHTYYGMQMTMDSYFSGKLLFVGDNLQTKWLSPPNQDLNGGNKTQSYCNKMILTNNNNYFEAELEPFAIGNRQYISSTDSVVFSTSYNKAYFRLVDWCDFTQGQVLNWRGHYKWYYKE